jgi:hypothetical protein
MQVILWPVLQEQEEVAQGARRPSQLHLPLHNQWLSTQGRPAAETDSVMEGIAWLLSLILSSLFCF